MLTLNKLAVLIAITGAVLYGARLMERVNAIRRAAIDRNAARAGAGARRD